MVNKPLSWLKSFEGCPNCKHQGFFLLEGKAVKCQCRVEYENMLRIINRYLESGLLNEQSSEEQFNFIKNYELGKYKGKDELGNIEKIKKYIDYFEDRYRAINLFFSGGIGTQKTTVSKYILSSLIKKNLTGYYILANDLICVLIDSTRNEEKLDFVKKIQTCDCLIIDEMSEDKIITYASGWQRVNFFPFLKTRLETIRKATIFISNSNISDIGNYFSGSIQDLIQREVPDQTMVFKDRYAEYKEQIDLSKLWQD